MKFPALTELFFHPIQVDLGAFALLPAFFGQAGLDPLQDIAPALAGFCGTIKNEVGFEFPLCEGFLKLGGVVEHGCIGTAVSLGEYERERNLTFLQPLRKIQILLQRFQLGVHQEKDLLKGRALRQVGAHILIEIQLFGFGNFRIAIARQIHQVPLLVNAENINAACFAGLAGSVGELLAPREHVD